jgi:iron complex transport system substrate-binding protein
MKFVTITFGASLAVALAQDSNPQACINPSDFAADVDFFPDKVAATKSAYWDIQYFNTYKIIRNELADISYVLYQCGTEPPTLNGTFAQTLSVPIQGCAVTSTTDIPYMELLGARTKMKGWVGFEGGTDYISSPCVKELISEGKFLAVVDATNASSPSLAAMLALDGAGQDVVAFVGEYDTTALNDVLAYATKETSNLGTLEWIKFYSAFFNLEAAANQVFGDAVDRYKCVSENAQVIATDSPEKPIVVWAYYTNYSGADGFDIAECPNYYCEYAEACGSTILSSREGSNIVDNPYGDDYVYMNITEFLAFAMSADQWIFPNDNWDVVYGLYKTELDTLPSVQNERVFDYQKRGGNSWYENRLAEPGK